MSQATTPPNPFNARATLATPGGLRDAVTLYRLDALDKAGVAQTAKLPVTIKVLLEAALRNCDGFAVTEAHIKTLANWTPEAAKQGLEVPFVPARVILQDFTGVPAVVDLAALRATMKRLGGDPKRINPQVPADLVIDHSVQVDAFGNAGALKLNSEREFERNRERYEFLRWGQNAFDNFSVVPPESGIVHQVNLEYLATVVASREENGELVAYPDSLVGTDSHTTMINGIGVLGWGVGGIEAEAAMLGQPIFMLMPEVVGVKLEGELPQGSTATDLVLAVTQMLRTHGVVGKFVEFCGAGLTRLSLADRATIANMAPEYGATCGFFPVDDETLTYMRNSARDEKLIQTVEAYAKEQGLWHSDELATYSDLLTLDMSSVEPSLAGPKRPQDRISLSGMKAQWDADLSTTFGKAAHVSNSTPDRLASEGGQAAIEHEAATATAEGSAEVEYNGQRFHLEHGAVVIAAITSCTNTSNPSVMLGAGLLAKKAVEAGLVTKPWVKTSLAPGSKVVTAYLKASGLLPYLEKLGFYLVGYGCTTCIGNSGPLPEEIAKAIDEADLVAASVLSGNRNFEGRINPHVRANYLASPPLVVAYALAGSVECDLTKEPLGEGEGGKPVYLKDIWPSQEEIKRTITETLKPEMFREQYAKIYDGPESWQNIQGVGGELYNFDENSTYIQEPPFFTSLTLDVPPVVPVRGGRVLALLGDSITTDHISPAGAIPPTSPAGKYLIDKGVQPRDFNSYGSRRGNHEVMMRGTFANIRIKNQLAPGTEGGVTKHFPSGEQMSIYDAAMRYQSENVPLVVLAGTEYGTGSSRDWAAKGTYLLGVKAVIAGSYERIHRSNLVFMGVLPLEFADGATWKTLGLTGDETYDIELPTKVEPRQQYTVKATKPQGATIEFTAQSRLDSAVEVRYWQQGGILHTVLRDLLQA